MQSLMWDLTGGKEVLCLVITSPGEGEKKWKTVQPIYKYSCYKYC